MRKFRILLILAACVFGLTIFAGEMKTSPQWSMNATAIEACSCPMFCQCYFHTSPATHHEHGAAEHYCLANLAYKINRGSYGSVKLDGAKFWISTNLGADWSKGNMDWAIVTFDKPLSKEQRDGIAQIVGHLFPVKWNSLATAEANIDHWEFNKDTAYASMDGGKSGEVKLKRAAGNTNDPVVIQNLKYFGAPRNDGFVLMPNEVEAYRVGPKAFEYRGTNGFMITVDINSNDVAKTSM
jgi:Uncharacterized conserved protein